MLIMLYRKTSKVSIKLFIVIFILHNIYNNMEMIQHLSSTQKALVEAKKKIHENKGNLEAVNHKIDLEIKAMVEKNAPMNSVTAGSGEQIVPDIVTIQNIVDNGFSANGRYSFLNGLSAGMQPWVLSQTSDLPIVWDAPTATVFSEFTTGTYGPIDPTNNFVTDKVTLNAKKIGFQTGISTELELYGVESTIAILNRKMQDSIFTGVADAVLNGDTSTGATGNINSDDALAATTLGATNVKVQFNNGLRLQPLNWVLNVDHIDVGGAITANDIFTAAGLMRSDSTPDKRIIILDNKTYNELMKDDWFKDLSKNGLSSTLSAGAITNINGMDVFVTDLMRRTEADGKISATAANNTRGQIIIAERNVIQHGFSTDIISAVQDHDLLKWFVFQAYTMFGFANINKKAWQTAPSIVALIDIN